MGTLVKFLFKSQSEPFQKSETSQFSSFFFLVVSALCSVSHCVLIIRVILCRIIPHTHRLAKTSMPSIIPHPLTGLIWPRTAWMAQAPRRPTSCKILPLPWPDRLLNFTQVCIKERKKENHTNTHTLTHTTVKPPTLHHNCNFINRQTNVHRSLILAP